MGDAFSVPFILSWFNIMVRKIHEWSLLYVGTERSSRRHPTCLFFFSFSLKKKKKKKTEGGKIWNTHNPKLPDSLKWKPSKTSASPDQSPKQLKEANLPYFEGYLGPKWLLGMCNLRIPRAGPSRSRTTSLFRILTCHRLFAVFLRGSSFVAIV